MPSASLCAALTRLAEEPGVRLTAVSRFWHSPAFPAGSGPDYVNACAAVDCTLSPEALLDRLHSIEAELGRVRDGGRWQARVVDLDLLAVGDCVLPDPFTQTAWRELPLTAQMSRAPDRLILPHPRLQDRGFVLGPLVDIAPRWHHPLLGQSVQQMWDSLPASARAALVPFA